MWTTNVWDFFQDCTTIFPEFEILMTTLIFVLHSGQVFDKAGIPQYRALACDETPVCDCDHCFVLKRKVSSNTARKA